MRWAPLCICIDKKRKWRCLKKKRNLHYQNTFEQIPRSHDFHIALQLCAFPVADNSQQRDQEDIRTINAEIIASCKKGWIPHRAECGRTARCICWERMGWMMVCLCISSSWETCWYSVLLDVNVSLTVFSGFGEHRSWNDISHFPHEKSLRWKREANDNEKQRKGKISFSISSRLCAGNQMTFAPYLSQPLSLLWQAVLLVLVVQSQSLLSQKQGKLELSERLKLFMEFLKHPNIFENFKSDKQPWYQRKNGEILVRIILFWASFYRFSYILQGSVPFQFARRIFVHHC